MTEDHYLRNLSLFLTNNPIQVFLIQIEFLFSVASNRTLRILQILFQKRLKVISLLSIKQLTVN